MGFDLVTWSPRIGATGDDAYDIPGATRMDGTVDTSVEHTRVEAGSSSFSDTPTIAEINASSHWNQLIAALNRRIIRYLETFGVGVGEDRRTSITIHAFSNTGNGFFISNATNASPIVVTSSSGNHGLVTGDKVAIRNVQGNTAANGNWTVTKVSDTVFSLDGSTGNASYTSSTGVGAYILPYLSADEKIDNALSNKLNRVLCSARGSEGFTTNNLGGNFASSTRILGKDLAYFRKALRISGILRPGGLANRYGYDRSDNPYGTLQSLSIDHGGSFVGKRSDSGIPAMSRDRLITTVAVPEWLTTGIDSMSINVSYFQVPVSNDLEHPSPFILYYAQHPTVYPATAASFDTVATYLFGYEYSAANFSGGAHLSQSTDLSAFASLVEAKADSHWMINTVHGLEFAGTGAGITGNRNSALQVSVNYVEIDMGS
jgi:hypothetical protein